MHKAATMGGSALVDRLLQGIQHKAAVGCAADPPANNIAGVDVDHGSDMNEPSPLGHVGKIGHPEPVRRRRMELRHCLVAERGMHRPAPGDAPQAQIAHQPLHRAAGNVETVSRASKAILFLSLSVCSLSTTVVAKHHEV